MSNGPSNSDDTNAQILAQRRELAESILGVAIDWQDDETGYLDCPGIDLHTTPDGERDCRVKLDGVPTLYCLHQNCHEVIAEANRKLRGGLLNLQGAVRVKAAAVKAADSSLRRKASTRKRDLKRAANTLSLQAKVGLHQIIEQFATPPQGWGTISTVQIDSRTSDHWRLLLRLYSPDDVLWIGSEVWMSSATNPAFGTYFRTIAEWLALEHVPGKYTCPSIFKIGTHSRSNANVVRRPFMVVESDTLTRTEMGAVFVWMRQFLTLRAVVDTAGKSLHGWFDCPSKKVEAELRVILPALGCDPALFKPSQPCRLPGAKRDERYQRLLFLDTDGVTK